MNKKTISVTIVVVILIVASVSAFVMLDDKDDAVAKSFDDAELKVYGNVNGDRFLDEADAKLIEQYVKDGKTVEDCPLADANQDGKLTMDDVEVVNAVVQGRATTINHLVYKDVDQDGVVDTQVVSTKFPVKSAIMTGSTNTSMLLFCLGITDQIKGASYSSSSLDKDLFKETYLDTTKCVKLGTSSSAITFEDGKAGSSDVIKTQNVTALITDWNRTYITNENDFENAGVDVVRVSAGSADKDALTHSAMLLGLLFQCADRANDYVDLSLSVIEYIQGIAKNEAKVKAVSSSMNGYLSTVASDYGELIVTIGGEYPLPVDAFGGATSGKIVDHPEIYANYSFDYILHVRSNLNYVQTQDTIDKMWNTYTKAFSDWEHSETGQYMISGMIPVAMRAAYAGQIFYSDVDADKVTEFHQEFVDKFFNGKTYDVSSLKFIISAGDVSS